MSCSTDHGATSMLPTIRIMIGEGVIESREHLALTSSGRERPQALDDEACNLFS